MRTFLAWIYRTFWPWASYCCVCSSLDAPLIFVGGGPHYCQKHADEYARNASAHASALYRQIDEEMLSGYRLEMERINEEMSSGYCTYPECPYCGRVDKPAAV
jgi:hypothetical protein